jgi:hypothetical protein
LPMRGQRHYWESITRLHSASTKAERQKITRDTGISRHTLCAASPAFSHPSFFPLDPFHLFYENCMVHMWDLWVTHSSESEKIHMDADIASQLGQEIEKAMATLPPSFSGPIRNPYKKRQSQYKVYEWMALLHWYIIPVAWELGFDKDVLRNFAQFVNIIEVAMSHSPKSTEDLASLYNLIKSFLIGFEELYVHDDAAKVSRCRLCIWQLIHIPHHISWNGSIRFGSQATCERAIGEIGHKVRSKKAPFANIATILTERASNRVLLLKYPSLIIPPKDKRKETPLYQLIPITKREKDEPSDYFHHLAAICDHLQIEFDTRMRIERWGKCRIPGGATLRSRTSEDTGVAARSSRYFEAQGQVPIFGEALVFYVVSLPDNKCNLVIYTPLVRTGQILRRWYGEWSKDYLVMETSNITRLIGIWEWKSKVHILRKHVGLSMLNVEEYGVEEEDDL